MEVAPIALFVFNRPYHTRKTLEALAENKLAENSVLYIFADGPKSSATVEELEKILETRKVIKERLWCGEVKIIESEKNNGLAASIVHGVTKVINEHGKIIVLEDDIVTSPGFLKYMNDALNFYEKEERVMHVAGYFPPVKQFKNLPTTFFFNETSCWGWGTWKEAWSNLQLDPSELLSSIQSTGLESKFNRDNSYPYTGQLQENIDGKIHTWAIKWYSSVFLKNGLCLHPRVSLIKNIGFDGSGIHCNDSFRKYEHQRIATSIEIAPIPLKELPLAREKVIKYNRQLEQINFKKVIHKIEKSFRSLKNQYF